MHRLEAELKTEFRRERQHRREELRTLHVDQESLEQRLGEDVREVRMKMQNFGEHFTVETKKREDETPALDENVEGVLDRTK